MNDFTSALQDPALDLTQPMLVEASAGTGKTYNLQNAYLRLILQHDRPVEKILVVTFTEAATHELRDRLRRILVAARDVCENRPCEDDARIRAIMAAAGISPAASPDGGQAHSRIKLALMNFDQAAIFTIHGFCQRVLSRFAFECGHDPLAELVPDASDIIARTCQDWWRTHTYADHQFRQSVPFKDVQELTGLLIEYSKQPDAVLAPRFQATASADLQVTTSQLLHSLQQRLERDGDLLASVPDLDEDTPLETAQSLATRTVDVPIPAALQALLQVTRQTGTIKLTGTIAWDGPQTITTPRTSFDLQPVQEIIHPHGPALRAWIARIEPYLLGVKPSQKVLALRDALQVVTEATPAPDAKTYLKAIRDVAAADLPAMLSARPVQALAPALASLLPAITDTLHARKANILQTLAETARTNIQARSVFTYQDMLRNVMLAIERNGDGPSSLAAVLRAEFQAAMIDEFQDTDPIQYSIFNQLFYDAGIPLIYVGDPKQAIYGFRGGDVFTYYQAKQALDASQIFGLGTNYRSERPLVDAINALFADRDGSTFLHAAIPYPGTLQAHGMDSAHMLQLPEHNNQPLQIWSYRTDNNKKPAAGKPETVAMLHHLADEMVQLLDDADCRIGARRIQPSDLAVLVHTHAEGETAQAILAEHGIYAVRQNCGNVFDSLEAIGLERILRAMLDPTDAFTLRGALVDDLLPCTTHTLLDWVREDDDESGPGTTSQATPEADGAASDAPQTLDDWMSLFTAVAGIWQRHSFIEACNHLMRQTRMRSHLIRQANGERKLTNILHLSELIHQADRQLSNNPTALLDWYLRQLQGEDRQESDEQMMRLTSDENAVKIMTIYKSKGLQFPIVFIPSLWRKKADADNRSKFVSCHDEQNNLILHVDTQNQAAKAQARNERLQEDIRLVYVALTRAINRVYLIQFPLQDPEAYALDHLLARLPDPPPATITLHEREAIAPAAPRMRPPARDRDPASLAVAGIPQVDHTHGHTSFSALEPQPRERSATEPRDLDPGREPMPPTTNPLAADVFSIPGGRQTGNCWHNIFELIDFTSSPAAMAAIVDQQLERFKICRGPTSAIRAARCAAVHRMVQQTLSTPLPVGATGTAFTLRQVAPSDRRSELAFDFTLRQQGDRLRTPAIRALLHQHWGHDPDKHVFLAALAEWDRELPHGFMTGLIDLVCCHDGRFYILDWKSNRRSGHIQDFSAANLQDEMARNTYFLQYLLYTVALHGYLLQHLTGYDYDRHMGGVFYVFLRGIEHPRTHGIFADRPSRALINELAALLTGTGGPA